MSLACETHISNHLEDILAFSGKSFGRIGNYNDCLTTTDLTYYLVGFLYQGNGIPPIGLCLPKECSADSVNTILTLLFKQAHLPLEVNYVAGDLDKFEYPYTWKFFVTLIIFITLVAMVLISSTVKDLRNHKILGGFCLQNSLKIF